ncbi:ATP binding [Ceratobasidium sp. 370]|nr:ATP binding [Ceratobasidium sp. 370]
MSVEKLLEPPPGVSYADFVRTWNDEQIAAWLTQLGCGHQASTFSDNDIRGNVILDLDQHALKEMDITSVGDRIKILHAVKSLRQKCTKAVGPTPRVLVNGGSTSRASSTYETVNGPQRNSSFRHGVSGPDESSIQAGRRSSGGRRLDGGRPPPLNITQPASRDLPQLTANSAGIATSPAPSMGTVTPRPSNQQLSQTANGRDQGRTSTVSTPLTATSVSTLPKYAPPTRSYGASLPVGQGRRTPTQGESFTPSSQSFPPPPYTNDPLPPAPSGNSPPTLSNVGAWQGEYGLPRGPRPAAYPGNPYESVSDAAARRAGSPLPPLPAPVRSSTAKVPIQNVDRGQAGHQKSGSVGLIGQGNRGDLGKSSAVQAALGRPSTATSVTGNTPQQALHPYAAAASTSTSSGAPAIPFPTVSPNSLQVNSAQRNRDLSPINEAYSISETTPTSGTYSFNSGPGSSGNNAGFAVKRGPFPMRNPTPSYDELQRSLIKVYLDESGQPTTAVNSSVVNVMTCEGGVDIIERALKKFNKGSIGKNGISTDDERTGETEGGGLIVDGWGLFPGGPQNEATGGPLSESQILAICHADPKHPTREQGLTLRNIRKVHSRKLDKFFGETPPGPGVQTSPTSPTYTVGPKLQSSQDEDGASFTPSSLRFQPGAQLNIGSKRMDRASTISIMSGLGVESINPPMSPGGTPSIRSPSGNSFLSGGHKKLRNFFGQRPPSELITSHLPDFFPSTSKKVLQRTARNSMLRAHSSKRDSRLSVMGGPTGRMSFQGTPKSRFSSSSAGSSSLPYNGRKSSSPPRSSIGSAPSIKDDASTTAIREEIVPPRMSVETDDGQSIDISTDDGTTTDDTESTKKSLDHTLPPLPIIGVSLSDSLNTGLTASWLKSESNATKRMSYHSTRGRDKSDTASLLTVDEITAEVESRRQSMISSYDDDEDDEDEDGNVMHDIIHT